MVDTQKIVITSTAMERDHGPYVNIKDLWFYGSKLMKEIDIP